MLALLGLALGFVLCFQDPAAILSGPDRPVLQEDPAPSPQTSPPALRQSPADNPTAFLPPEDGLDPLPRDAERRRLQRLADSVVEMEKEYFRKNPAVTPREISETSRVITFGDDPIPLVVFQDPTAARRAWSDVPGLNGAPELRRELLSLEERRFWNRRDEMADVELSFAQAFAGVGLRRDAEALLLRSYAIHRAGRGLEHPLTQRSIEDLIRLYDEWGKKRTADWYRELLAKARSRGESPRAQD